MFNRLIQLDLQLFAGEGSAGEKTEEATPKKLEDARKEGQVARSTDIISAFMLLGMFLTLKVFVGTVSNGMKEVYVERYSLIGDIAKNGFTKNMGVSIIGDTLISVVKIGFPFLMIFFIIALFVELWQVKWKISGKPLKPKFSKINPLKGFKRIISLDKLFELLKSIVKLSIIGIIVYTTLSDELTTVMKFYDLQLSQAIGLIGNFVITLGIKISVAFLIFAILDLFYQKKKFQKEMRMTKQEVKDEYKNVDGDPQIKGKIKQKMREAARQRMMNAVPEADVVITNPTHFAVAIRYDKEKTGAPVVVAKGADYVASRIKKKAKENEVEIVENKPLARMLYFNVEIGDEIPQEMYQMVAEVLAYVYRIKNKI